MQWEAINPPLTSSADPPHRPPQLISEVKKTSVSHRCMNKSSSPGSEEDLCHDSRPNELRSLWSRFSQGTWSPLLTECSVGKAGELEGRRPTGACERGSLGSCGSRPPNNLVMTEIHYYLRPTGELTGWLLCNYQARETF